MDNKYILKSIVKKTIVAIIIVSAIFGYTELSEKCVSTNVAVNEDACKDLLAEYETYFNEQNINRSANIKLAAAKINDTVILPNEIFSYNDTVGSRTEEAGFKLAHIYQAGQIVDGIGGGICQISSTLYNACLYANLEILERRSHQFMPSYIQTGMDATVSDGYIDFKFKNTRNYPIKIVCVAKNGILKCQIYGTKEEIEYDIELQSIVTEEIPYEIEYLIDENNKQGNQTVIRNGKIGYKCKVYKITKLNGNILSKVMISNDIYNAINEIIKIEN